MTTPQIPAPGAPVARRPFRWLRLIHVLLVLAMIPLIFSSLAVLVAVVVAALGLGAYPVRFPVVGDVAQAVAGLPDGVRIEDPTTVVLRDPTFGQAVLWALGPAVGAAFALVIVVMLQRLVSAATSSDPFTMGNARRLRRIGVLMVAGQLAYAVVTVVAHWALAVSVLGDRVQFPYFEQPWLGVFAGIAIIAVAEVVRHGVAMREELDEVV